MTIRCLIPALLLVSSASLFGQRLGDHATAGYDSARTGLNVHAGPLAPPILLQEVVTLSDNDSADSLLVFEDYFLVGQGGSPTVYRLYGRDGVLQWSNNIPSEDEPLDYVPAFANDIVLLGGPATSTVKAVRVSTGVELWTDSSVGSAQGRHPWITDDLALYHGLTGVVARRASTRTVLWSNVPTTTAAAPVAVFGDRVFVGGSLTAYSLRAPGPGPVILWGRGDGFGGDGSDLIATESYVFQTDPATGGLRALSAVDGADVWSATPGSFGDPGIALAYDRLYAFVSDEEGVPWVRAYNPDTGELLWEQMDPSGAEDGHGSIRFAAIANNVIYYVNDPGPGQDGRLRALDAFSGNPMWSLRLIDRARALSIADGKLFVLFDESIRVYCPVYQIYFPQYADGIVGISTLLTINNLGSEEATGKIELFTSAADPLEITSEERGDGSSFDIMIPANESVRLQSTASNDPLAVGWARVTLDQPVSGSAIFQINDGTTFTFEAGVGDSAATGLGSIFARRLKLPAGAQFGTGVAFANVVDEAATVSLEFLPKGGGAKLVADDIVLGAGTQIARFLAELFEGIDENAEGTLVIRSDIPVVITALRTNDGFPFSSYPVGQRP